MSCTDRAVLRLFAPLAGVTAERLSLSVDAMKHRPPPPIPLDSTIVDALASEASAIPSHGNRGVVEQRVQEVVQGLISLVRATPNIPTAARIVALLHALSPLLPPLPLVPPRPLVQRLRTLLLQPPPPTSLTGISDQGKDVRQLVIGSLRNTVWGQHEIRAVAAAPDGAAIALAAGVVHPDLRTAVLANPDAIVMALTEGYTDPEFIATAAAAGSTARDTLLARPDLARNSALLAAVTSSPQWAADVLIAVPDIPFSNTLLAAVAQSSYYAAKVLIQRPEMRTHNDLINAVQGSPADAADVMIACPDLRDDPRLLATVAKSGAYTAKVLAHCPPLPSDEVLAARVSWPLDAAKVLLRRPDLRTHAKLVAVLKQSVQYRLTKTNPMVAEAAAQILITVPESRMDPDLITLAGRSADAAAQALIGCPELRTNVTLLTAAKKSVEAAANVLVHCPDLHRRRALITAAAKDPHEAARVLMAHPAMTDDQLIASVSVSPRQAAKVMIHRPDLRNLPVLHAAVARSALASAETLIRCPDLRDPALIAPLLESAATNVNTAAAVVIHRRDLRDPRLIDMVATSAHAAVRVVAECPELMTDAIVRRMAEVGGETMLVEVIQTIGPHPVWWQTLSVEQANWIMDDWNLSETERTWLVRLMKRARSGEVVWTAEDEQVSKRFRWKEAFRHLLTRSSAGDPPTGS